MGTFIQRMIGVARFDRRTYEQVESDSRATGQALGVVLLARIGSGIGWVGLEPRRLEAVFLLTLTAVAGWVTWALLTYLIGTRIFPETQTQADPGQLLRTLGFAQSPGVLRPLALVPGIGPVIAGITIVWALATMVVAVRQALDYLSTLRALAVCATGWVLALTMFWVIGMLYATPVS